MTHHPMLDARCLPFYEWLDVPIWVFDAQRMRKAWANPAGLAYWKAATLDELLARDYADASAGSRARLDLAMQAHARGEVFRESWTLFPHGKPVTSTLMSRGYTLDDGRPALMFIAERLPSNVDPTTLRGLDAVQRTTVRIALHALADGRALMRNPAAAQAFGLVPPADAPAGANAFDALFAEPGTAERILAAAREGHGFSAELPLRTLEGTCWHAVDVRPMLDPVSGERALLFDASDIAELKATQQALEHARIAADNANMAKTAFLANMSHELRTPMNGVLGLTELALRSGELNERQYRFIGLAHQSAQGLMVIINDLLDVAKIEAGRMVIERAPFSLQRCIAEAISPLAPSADAKGLRLDWQIAPELPDEVRGDVVRLRQVLVNLVGNALKFTHAGAVVLDVRRDPEAPADDADGIALHVSVRDTGIGMSAEQLARVFEPFMQADNSITRRYGGTGLGLTIVARLVALMGGAVQVTSTAGVGTCVAFTLRVARVG